MSPVSSRFLAHDGAFSGAAAAQPHPDVLIPGRLLRRPRLLEPSQPGFRGLQPRGHRVVIRRLLPVHPDELLDLLVLLVPAAAQLIKALDAVLPGLRVGREAAAVDPDAAVFHGDDALRAVGQQFPVVAHQQHRLAGGGELLLQPAFAGHIQVVVRLIEQEHIRGPAQQRLEHQPFLLAAGQGAQFAPAAPLIPDSQGGEGARVPEHLGVVASGVAPFGQGRRITHLGGLVVALHHGQLGRIKPLRRRPQSQRRDRNQQVPDRGVTR